MQFTSTRNNAHSTTLSDAVITGLAPDGGLYVPASPLHNIASLSHNTQLHSVAFELLFPFCKNEFDKQELTQIIHTAFNFPLPIIQLEKNLYVCELFHGPTLAFKDFGARFIAQLLNRFMQQRNQQLTILVATSGDTGSAVASGFFQLPNINVIILYPEGKVSPLQELQLTTYGHNIKALKVEGTFDDCQRLVKQAFNDPHLRARINLSSANSINIGRLLPQMIYYGVAARQIKMQTHKQPQIVVPSGNFGNLMAGLMAMHMGEPIRQFIAAVNANDVIPHYLHTKTYHPQPSRHTLSNAMDVGAPSNIERIDWLYHHQVNDMHQHFSAHSISDAVTTRTMQRTYSQYQYIADPHTAVGIAAAALAGSNGPQIIMATAHPAKFKEVVEQALQVSVTLPPPLAQLLHKPSSATVIPADFHALLPHIA